MFVKSTRFKQVCQLLLFLIVALEENNQNPTVFERLECVARFIRASQKPSR